MKKEIEFTSVTTRGGDRGESSLASGDRKRKDDVIFHALGDLDELGAAIGMCRSIAEDKVLFKQLREIQSTLLQLSGMVATPETSSFYKQLHHLSEQDVVKLEKLEKQYMKDLPPFSQFLLPGDTEADARYHMARTVCRRAERRVVTLIRDLLMVNLIPCQKYLNRLSDLLFILAYRASLNK